MKNSRLSRVDILKKKIDAYFKLHYRVGLDKMTISEVPGYWEDNEPKEHPGHPLCNCLFCDSFFKAAYAYYDKNRDDKGRFQSRTRSWMIIKRNP